MSFSRRCFVVVMGCGLGACGSGGDGGPPVAPVFDAGQGGTSGTGGSGGSGTGATGGSETFCQDFCEVVQKLNCPEDGNCIADCEQKLADAGECAPERRSSLNCVISLPLACNPGGHADPDPGLVFDECLTEAVAEVRCNVCRAEVDDDACDTCGKESCCEERKAVAEDPSFEAFSKCTFDCNSDQACLDGCDQQFSSLSVKVDASVACHDANCATICNP